MGAGSGTVMLLIMPVAASGCANSTGPEDNEGRVLPRVQGVAELAVLGVAAGFKISAFSMPSQSLRVRGTWSSSMRLAL